MKKLYMLDTDICSYIIRENPMSVLKKFEEVGTKNLCISVITYAELHFGANKKNTTKLTEKINLFTSLLTVINFDINSALQYAGLRNSLELKGITVGNMDLLIASVALANDCILVTNNNKHFKTIPNLQLENWV